MKNQKQDGEVLTLTAPYDVASGGGVKFGAIIGVASSPALSGEPVQVKRRGVFELPKASAQAWSDGDKLYWDDANKVLTTTATGNTLCGAAVAAAANPSATGLALLDGVIR
ncbi:DUF2190 family protein [Leisingera caerulea]|uniref:DUF2190 family protein n=1 Tax=Leisingera caerulea TaxID=506591 RepID=A0ABY5X042_LEICA|nr:DUF2190 family protein [Leisingera caerulea]UWQ59961.1 DUF2190 family protein [Leisingera caerulea]